MKTIQVKVNNATQTIAEHTVVTQDGKPTVIKAVQKVNYELFDTETGKAPQHIITKRVGKDLHVSVDEDGQESDLIIEGFYKDPDSALIGLAEDGAYHYYVPDSGEIAHFVTELSSGDVTGQALGGQAQSNPWWVGASESDGFNALPWLIGLAGLGIAGAALGGGSSSSKGSDKDTTAPNPPTVDDVINIDEDGDGTPDRTVISGKTEPGAEIIVKDKDGNVIGKDKADKDGSYEVEVPALDKDEVVDVTAKDEAGNESDPTEVVGIGDDIPPNDQTTGITIDDVTDDNIINTQEAEGMVAVTGTVDGEFTAGDKVTLIINGNVFTGEVDATGKFSIDVPGVDLVADSDSKIEGSVIATDAAGNAGTINTTKDYSVDTQIPEAPSVIVSIDGTRITGVSEPDANVIIRDDDGNKIGEAIADVNGNYELILSDFLTLGEEVNAVAIDSAGNGPSDAAYAIAPHFLVSIADADPVDEGGSLEFEVTLTGGVSSTDLVIPVSYTGTATDGSDYTSVGTVTIKAGETTGKLVVETLEDQVFNEGDETVVVTLGESTENEYSLGTATAEGVIYDINDPTDPVDGLVVSIADADPVDEGGSLEFEVTLTGGDPCRQSRRPKLGRF